MWLNPKWLFIGHIILCLGAAASVFISTSHTIQPQYGNKSKQFGANVVIVLVMWWAKITYKVKAFALNKRALQFFKSASL